MGAVNVKQGANQGSVMACRRDGWGQEEVQERGDICMLMADVAVWQRPTQYCKSKLSSTKNKPKNKIK